jgi:hypothetical protein
MDAAQSTLNNDNKSEPQEVFVKREPERDLLVWTAPARPFRKRDRQYFVSVFAIAGIVSLVIFIAEGLMPVVLIVALVFLYYILSTVPPENIEYKITNKGVKVADSLTQWPVLIRFWFGKRGEVDILFFETHLIPGRMELVINSEIKNDLKKEISAYIPFEEAPATGLDKVTGWVGSKLPGNE